MAISRLATQDAKNTASAATITATYAATPTVGNLLIATCFSNVTTGLNTLTGWTKALDTLAGTNAGASGTVFYKVAGASEPTATTVTATGASNMRLHIYEYTGLDTVSPFVTSNTANSGASIVTTQTTNTVTTVDANTLLFTWCFTSATITGPAWDSSFTLRQTDAALIRIFDGDQIVSATGTYSSNATWTTSTRTTAAIFVFKAASAGTPTVSSSNLLLMGV